jgi:uncharacterized protein (TIGR03435 family)
MATGIDNKRMSSAPGSDIAGWTDDETWDLTAITADHAEGFMYVPHGVSSTQQFPKALLALLEDRFALKFREEEKEVSVYLPERSKPGKPGPGLTQSGPTLESHCGAPPRSRNTAPMRTDRTPS